MAGSHETPVFSKRMKRVCHTGSTVGEEQHRSWCALSLRMWSETSAQGTVSLISRVGLTNYPLYRIAHIHAQKFVSTII